MAWACLFPDRKAFVQHVWGQASRSILVVFCQGQSTSHLKTPFLQRNRPSLIVGLQNDERWWLEGHAHQIMDGRWCSTQIAWVLVSKTFQRRRITSQSDWKCSVSPNGALRLPNIGGNVVKRFFTMGSCKILIHYFRFPNLKLDWPWWRFQRGHMSCNKCGWGVKIGIAWWCPCYWHVMLPYASNRFSFKKKTGLSRPACLRSVIRLEPVCGLSVALVGPARFLEVVWRSTFSNVQLLLAVSGILWSMYGPKALNGTLKSIHVIWNINTHAFGFQDLG